MNITSDQSSGQPIKTYNEKIERDISNIIARCSTKSTASDGMVVYAVGDLDMLTIELMEYFIALKK